MTGAKPLVVPIPVGPQPVAAYLESLQQEGYFQSYAQPRVLLLGLCGSLTPQYVVGSVVLYQDCVYQSSAPSQAVRTCDRQLTNSLHHKLLNANLVTGLTSDRIICSAAEKGELGKIYSASVVDMEGFAVLEALSSSKIAVAMVRVVSDSCHHNLPDLTSAISPSGSLQPLPLALRLIQQPIAGTRLIRGALRGLQVLQQVTTCLFQE